MKFFVGFACYGLVLQGSWAFQKQYDLSLLDIFDQGPFINRLPLNEKPCSADMLKGTWLLPYVNETSDVHAPFDSFPAYLIAKKGGSCSLRPPIVSEISGLQRLTVDFVASNVVDCSSTAPRLAARITHRIFQTKMGGLPYKVIVPPACSQEGAGCPFVLALHGTNGGTVLGQALNDTVCMDSMRVVAVIPVIVDLIPTIFKDWGDIQFLRPFIQEVQASLAPYINMNARYLYGQSMGGSGALAGALSSSDLFTDVFSISPQHFWTDPADSIALMKPVMPVFQSKVKEGSTTLRRIIITVGGRDAIHDDIPDPVGIIPTLLKQAGVFGAGISVEVRFFPNYGHVSWPAAFNVLYGTLWRGN